MIFIPASVEFLGVESFGFCTVARNLTFERGSNLRQIDPVAFTFCSKVTSVCIPSSVEILGTCCFYRVAGIIVRQAFSDGSRLSRIDDRAFEKCPLELICIPASVEMIGERAFSTCKSMSSSTFELPSTIRSLFSIPFFSCSSIDIPDSVEVLISEVCVTSGRHLVLTFGPDSHLHTMHFHALPEYSYRLRGVKPRIFVRLAESTLKSFRSHFSGGDESGEGSQVFKS
jgi:hypothetical protein